MIKKNQHTCRWKVEYRNMAYDMGVGADWDQYYFTWIGAHISRLTHNHLRSWGGHTKVVRVPQEEE